MPPEAIQTAVSCCAWMVNHNQVELAFQMRNELCHEWEVDAESWNEACSELRSYAVRKGGGDFPEYPYITLMVDEEVK